MTQKPPEIVCPTCGPLTPFRSDGCSAWWDKFLGVDYYSCCEEHDMPYWRGGPLSLKAKADWEMDRCVMQKYETAGKGRFGKAWGRLMRKGVKAFGSPILPTPWRWGYGHKAGCYGKDMKID